MGKAFPFFSLFHFTGNGTLGLAVFRPANATWYFSQPASHLPFGQAGDIPAPKRPAYPAYPY